MKFNKKVIALLLVLSIVLSVVIPLSLTSGSAVTGLGVKATYYKATKDYFAFLSGVENHDANFTSDSQQFEATKDKMIASSGVIETNSAVTSLAIGDRGNHYIIKWTGTMTATTGGTYTLVGRKIDNGFVMFVNGEKVYEYWGIDYFDREEDGVPVSWLPSAQGSFTVTNGETCNVEIYFLEVSGGQALDIYATTSPDEKNSGSSINDAFTFALTETVYRSISTDGNSSLAMNNFIGPDLGRDTNGATCVETNMQYEESFDRLIAAMNQTDVKTVPSFSDALIDEERYVIVYEGTLVPQETGSYTFGTYAIDNGFYMEIEKDGQWQTVYELWAGGTWNTSTTTTYTSSISLTAGQPYSFKAAFLETNGGQSLELNTTLDETTAPISSYFTFYSDTASDLSFNLRAVNALNGDTSISSSTELTIQYTDATLGEGIEMWAALIQANDDELVEQKVCDLNVLNQKLDVSWEDSLGTISSSTETGTVYKPVFSDTAGAVTFNFSNLSGSYDVSAVKVKVWIEGGVYNKSSNKATTTINSGFINSGTPKTIDFGPTNWMDYIDGSTLLSQINIPGTHDTATMSASANASICQTTTIEEQLNMGVRYLDIRAFNQETATGFTSTVLEENKQITKSDGTTITINDFNITHGASYCKIPDTSDQMGFSYVYLACEKFLRENPTECIVMAVSPEAWSVISTMDCDRVKLITDLQTYVEADPDLFYTKTTEIPTLDDVRGKIVLLRRFPSRDVGDDYDFMDFYWIDYSKSNQIYGIFPKSNNAYAVTTYHVQDDYSLVGKKAGTGCDDDTYPKWEYAKAFLETAASSKEANEYYLNFFSTAPSGNPVDHYTYTNAQFTDYVTAGSLKQGTQYGYLLFDGITAEICSAVYNTNIFTTVPQSTKNDKSVVHYTFDAEDINLTTNTIVDDNANGFDGTLVNTDLLEVNSIYDFITFNNAGKSGTAAGHIEIPQSVFRGTGDTATVQVWMKDTAEGKITTLFQLGNATGVNHFTAITEYPADKVGVRYAVNSQKGNGTSGVGANSSAQTANKWHLVTYVMDNGQMEIYVDGVSVATGTTPANFSDIDSGIFTDAPVLLGGDRLYNDQGFTGSMGEFSIYNYARTATDIASDYERLSKEFTYILSATLGSSTAVVSNDSQAESYILEKFTEDTGSVIYLTVPFDYDLKNAKLFLEYDASQVEIYNNDVSQGTYVEGNTYDLSGEVVLWVTSLDGSCRVKKYNLVITKSATPSLLLHYDFENITDGMVEDVTGNGFNGSLADGATANDTTVSLNGDKAHVVVDRQVMVNTGDAFTITMFVKPERIADTNTLLSYGSSQTNRLVILTAHGDSKAPRWNILSDSTETGMDSGGETRQRLVLSQWAQVTFTQENGTLKLYINNELINTATGISVTPSQIGDATFWLGAANVYTGDPGFNGEIADFRIYSTALTAKEVFALYQENYLDNNVTLDASKLQLEGFYDWNKNEISDLKTEYNGSAGSGVLAGTAGGATYQYKNVDFGKDGKNYASITFYGGSQRIVADATVKIYVDSISAENLIGSVALTNLTNSTWDLQEPATIPLNRLITGIHDIYYVLEGETVSGTSYVGNHDYVEFTKDNSREQVVVKDYNTGDIITEYYEAKDLTTITESNYQYLGWYTAQGGNETVGNASVGETVYLHRVKIDAPVHSGASIRFEDKDAGITSGIRFKASISRDEFYEYFMGDKDYVYNEFADDFKFGILLIPQRLIDAETDLNLENTSALNIEGKNVYNQNKDGYLEYTGVLKGIPESFYTVQLVARAYITYTVDGSEDPITIYTDVADVDSYEAVAWKAYSAYTQGREPNFDDTDVANLKDIIGLE